MGYSWAYLTNEKGSENESEDKEEDSLFHGGGYFCGIPWQTWSMFF